MSTCQTGGIKLSIESFETPRGATRVVTLGQNSLSMKDAELFTGMLVLACVKPTYTAEKSETKLRKIIIDMAQVTHINFEVLRAFLELQRITKLRSVLVVIACLRPEPLELIQKLMLADKLTITETVAQGYEL